MRGRGWLVALLLLASGCGAGARREVRPADVSPELAGSRLELNLRWVETGNERYDRFFREAAALQAALDLAERGEGDPAFLARLLRSVGPRSEAALAEGEALLATARADFADDERKSWAIEPALHEAIGQVRDAAARAPAILARLRSGEVLPAAARQDSCPFGDRC